MEVQFRTKRLQECYQRTQRATRQWDEKVARRYIERVNILKSAKTVNDLGTIPQLRFHPLKDDKEGYYSITPIDRWRMEVSFKDEARTIVRVEGVTQHYGD